MNTTTLQHQPPISEDLLEVNRSGLVHTASPDEFLPPINLLTTLGGLFLVVIFGTGVALSTVLKYKVTIQAPATIRPVGELRIVQTAIEGSIASIVVKENQIVKEGDVIATINDSRLQTKQTQLTGDSLKARQQMVAIDAQIMALDRQGGAEVDRINRAIAGVQAELVRAQREYRDKQLTSTAQVAEADANFGVADRERQAATVELQIGDANLKSIIADYRAAVAKRNRYQSVAAAGAISQNQLEEAQLATEQKAQAIMAQQGTISKQRQVIARLINSQTASQAIRQRAQATLNPSTADMSVINEKIAIERASGNANLARLQKEREQLLQLRGEAQSQIVKNQSESQQLAIDLQSTIVRAPIAGVVQELNLRNNSQVVTPGERIAQIFPSGAPIAIKAAVTAQDIGKVAVGQKVQMRVSACPYTENGILSGKVTTISPDAKLPTKTTGTAAQSQPENRAGATYEVSIQPDVSTLSTGTTKCVIQPGMEGRADIISKEETVLQFALRKARLLVNP